MDKIDKNKLRSLLCPLSKEVIWVDTKKYVYAKVLKGKIETEKGDTILEGVKELAYWIESEDEAWEVIEEIQTTYPEIESVSKKFFFHFFEGIENILQFIVEQLVNNGKLEVAEDIIGSIEKHKEEEFEDIKKLQNNFPEEFDKALKKVIEKQNILSS